MKQVEGEILSRTLRIFATTVVLLLGLFGSAVGFAATSSAAETSQTAAVTATGKSMLTGEVANGGVKVTRGTVRTATVICPLAKFVSAAEFDYNCIVTSGHVDIVAFCADGTVVQTGPLPPGTYSGFLYCPSGIVAVEVVPEP